MKIYSITFQTVLNAFRHQWKRILVLVLLFALLGASGGLIFRNRGMAEAGGSAQPLPPVDFVQIACTEEYYTDCLSLITDTLRNLNDYIYSVTANGIPTPERNTVQNIDGIPFSGRQSYLKALKELSREAYVFQSSQVTPLQSTLGEAGTVYVPEEYLDGMADRLTRELETLRMDLVSAEAATEIIRQMDAPDYDGGHSGSYGALLSLASQYPTLLRTQAVTEKRMDELTDHMPKIRAECRQVERKLEEAAEELNILLDRFTSLADEIAKEAGLTFTPTGANGRVDITVTHSHRASSAGESFAVIMTFCMLVGLCLGVFLAVCQEAKAEKCCFSGQTEAQSPDTSP